MRLIALFFITALSYASEFPHTFSSAGDAVYENMEKYAQIKDLDIYKDRPELLEAYCFDANRTMQKGFALDRVKEDPELLLDKAMIKSYAKELRGLSNRNEAIALQLEKEIQRLYQKGDLQSLKRIKKAGFAVGPQLIRAIEEDVKKQESAKNALPVSDSGPAHVEESSPAAAEALLLVKSEEKPEVMREPALSHEKTKESVPIRKPPTKLEYYTMSLVNLKDELYTLRESEDKAQMACLNDITAINYWMIRVLESGYDSCSLRDAIKQMKSYDKAAASSCGRDSMRYIEWHGRIRPYVGKKLFEAEAGCNQ